MPGTFLTSAQRQLFDSFPREIPSDDLIAYFSLTDRDLSVIQKTRRGYNQLGFALQLCALRFLGFVPSPLVGAPQAAIEYLAEQLDVNPEGLERYGEREQTRTQHLRRVARHLGFRITRTEGVAKHIENWMVERALEHARPITLFHLTREKLQAEKFVRPGLTVLERAIATSRERADDETNHRLKPLLTEKNKALLDSVLAPDKALNGHTLLHHLRKPANSNTAPAISANLDRIALLKGWGVDAWDLSKINVNRLKYLAQLGRKSTNQILQQKPERRRYQILIAFLYQSLLDITDETADMFVRLLSTVDARSERARDEQRKSLSRATNEKLQIFSSVGHAILDKEIRDTELRPHIYGSVSKQRLQDAIEECDRIMRPLDDNHFDFIERRYNYLRKCSPKFLATLEFDSNRRGKPILRAVEKLRALNAKGQRKMSEGADIDFVPRKWRPYVIDSMGVVNRHYYELCVLYELRDALRAGEIWVRHSRRYADPESYLIPPDEWAKLRQEVCKQIKAPVNGEERVDVLEQQLGEMLDRVDVLLAKGEKVRVEGERIVVTHFDAEQLPPRVSELEKQINRRLPRVELADLLMEVDSWTQFNRRLKHASGRKAEQAKMHRHKFAAVLAQACNIGNTRMANIAGFSYKQLTWCSKWYLGEETLKDAIAGIVNYHHRLRLSKLWGGGTMSSSDCMRLPVKVKTQNAVPCPKYFSYGLGLSHMAWTSDHFAQYGTKVVPTTERDATYVLDEILGNETELPILEHTTDTAGYTGMVFALFGLVDKKFSPRIRGVGGKALYRINTKKKYKNLGCRLTGRISKKRILRHWDDLIRVGGSLKLGWVTASLLISKLQAQKKPSDLVRALLEYGRLEETIFILRYIEDEEYRRRINRQLNKGESLNGLRRFLFFANAGKIRKGSSEEQINQALCLTLVTNAVITWNTRYMDATIKQLKKEGYPVFEEDLVHLSPARYEHINPYGRYSFDLAAAIPNDGLWPLRNP